MMAVDSPQEETELDDAEENNGPDVNAGMYLRIPQHVFFLVWFCCCSLFCFVLFCFVVFFCYCCFSLSFLYPALDFFESSDHDSDIDQPQPPPHTDWTDVCICSLYNDS